MEMDKNTATDMDEMNHSSTDSVPENPRATMEDSRSEDFNKISQSPDKQKKLVNKMVEEIDATTSQERGSQSSRLIHMKITRVLVIVIGFYLLSYFPQTSYTIAYTFNLVELDGYMNYWLTNFLYSNCFLNPIVYLILYPTFRSSLRKLVRYCFDR